MTTIAHVSIIFDITPRSSIENINRACQEALQPPFDLFVERPDFPEDLRRAMTTTVEQPGEHSSNTIIRERRTGIALVLRLYREQQKRRLRRTEEINASIAELHRRAEAALADTQLVLILGWLKREDILRGLRQTQPDRIKEALDKLSVMKAQPCFMMLDVFSTSVVDGVAQIYGIDQTMAELRLLWDDFTSIQEWLYLYYPEMRLGLQERTNQIILNIEDAWYDPETLRRLIADGDAILGAHVTPARRIRQPKQIETAATEPRSKSTPRPGAKKRGVKGKKRKG